MCICVPVSITHTIVVTDKRICVSVCVSVCVCVCVRERERERELISKSGTHLRWSGLTPGSWAMEEGGFYGGVKICSGISGCCAQ